MRLRPGLVALALYLLIAAVYTHPLLRDSGTLIASDPGDPVLNASILWWNATTVPFAAAWWNPPFFYPAHDIATFTENLQGITPLSTPIYWLTGNPLATYNLSLFLTWPLSGLAMFFLIRHLTGRDEAGFVAGLAFGFSPYRLWELSHLQMLCAFWLPLVLLGLHGYVADRRRRWLVLFGAAWLLQSFANGYLMLFGGVLIAAWVVYFCSARQAWRALPAITVAWILASLPLLPVLLRYRQAHEYYGLRRSFEDLGSISAPASALLNVSPLASLWSPILPSSGELLFPGLTAALLAAVGVAVALGRWPGWRSGARAQRLFAAAMAIGLMVGLAGTIATLLAGPWRVSIAGLVLRAADINRSLGLTVISAAAIIAIVDPARQAAIRRSPFLFYALAVPVAALVSMGPLLQAGGVVLFEPAPYRWLMRLPGFNELRVPTRFWMIGVLCLSAAGGLGFAQLRLGKPARLALLAMAMAGVMADGWIGAMPMSAAPETWSQVERGNERIPILELPLGPDWDGAATFRAIGHRRPVVNGVSGYDPAHYAPLQAGLNARDPAMLSALASRGPIDVVVDAAADPDGSWTRYVAALASRTTATDGVRTAYRIDAAADLDAVVGAAVPIARVTAFRHDAAVIVDGRIGTEWGDDPQRPGQWILADLGEPREVAGITHAIGEYGRDFPRHLLVETSRDGATWEPGWEGPTAALAFLAAARGPREAAIHIAFTPRVARFVRLRQLANHRNMWRLAELTIHAPAS